MLPTDQLYREQLSLLYDNPQQLAPRVITAYALVESGQKEGVKLLEEIVKHAFHNGEAVTALWCITLLKKYAPLVSVKTWIDKLSNTYGQTLHMNIHHKLSALHMTDDSHINSEIDALDVNLQHLSGEELAAQTLAVASDFSMFDTSEVKVGNLPLFCAFDALVLQQIFHALEVRYLSQSDLLIEEGEEADGVYLLCYGHVNISRRTQEGETIDLATIGAGSLVGEMGLITQSPRVATAIASDDVWTIVLPLAAYTLLQENQTQVHEALAHLVGGRMLHNLTKFSPIFKVIPASAHPNILAEFQSIVVEPGEVLLKQGEFGRGLFLILDGLVRVTQLGNIHPKWLREGDVFGEISLIYESPVSATCTALRRCLLFTLTPERFKSLIDRHPEVRHTLTELSLFRNLDSLYTLT
jgi:cAMP-dependent protein kinase regulator